MSTFWIFCSRNIFVKNKNKYEIQKRGSNQVRWFHGRLFPPSLFFSCVFNFSSHLSLLQIPVILTPRSFYRRFHPNYQVYLFSFFLQIFFTFTSSDMSKTSAVTDLESSSPDPQTLSLKRIVWVGLFWSSNMWSQSLWLRELRLVELKLQLPVRNYDRLEQLPLTESSWTPPPL